MKYVWIHDNSDLGTVQHTGNISSLSVSVHHTDDYVEENKEFLLDLLCEINVFPLYAAIEEYDEYEENEDFLKRHQYEYDIKPWADKRVYWTLGKTHSYHPPCFHVKVKTMADLIKLMTQTYYLAAQNQFFGLSFHKPIEFVIETKRRFWKKGEWSVPFIDNDSETTMLIIDHDGQGFTIYSNEEKFSSIEAIQSQLPHGYKVGQEIEPIE
ncbi:hypothetical protein J2S09_003668 [Bacillus fengqiuensis]|nr:hypothetical protein [Bacillus fengqiuensis]